MTPFFSIVSVTYQDVWSLTKTARSLYSQEFTDFEYVIVDGASTDGTLSLIAFWEAEGMVAQVLSEPDSGVYDGMNKALALARGEYVCFLNAGDIFADDQVLTRVHDELVRSQADGLLGWGELNGQIWASWIESEAFMLASLGFCHQALFVKRARLLEHPFDARAFKTDSDTKQLAQLYAAGARIPILPEVLAIRGVEPGLSADPQRSRVSILATLTEAYPHLNQASAEQLLDFRRHCAAPEPISERLGSEPAPLKQHLALMVLDTLLLCQSVALRPEQVERLVEAACDALAETATGQAAADQAATALRGLLETQRIRRQRLTEKDRQAARLQAEIQDFARQEASGLEPLPAQSRLSADEFGRLQDRSDPPLILSLTSFPERLATLPLVIRSLRRQTAPAAAIHLWLGENEVMGRAALPSDLLALEQQGLRIHLVPKTAHQYDKFLHLAGLEQTFQCVLVDDDVIYPPDMLSALRQAARAHPGSIIANRAHRILTSADGAIAPYRHWQQEVSVERPVHDLFPTGAGGVLYPMGFLTDPLVRDHQRILALAPYADDLWLKTCALVKGVASCTTRLADANNAWLHRYTPTMTQGALHAVNVKQGLNDLQLKRCLAWFAEAAPERDRAWREQLQPCA